MSKPKFYITTAIPYANGAPHIGHAYERIATDAIARFKRLDGYDVFFVTGMDEHGQKMQQTAAREGITPQALADRTAAQFEQMGEDLNARADDIQRTTSERHRISVQEIWRRMAARGDIYLSKYAGVVDQNVDRTCLGFSLGDHGHARLEVGDVAGNTDEIVEAGLTSSLLIELYL